MALKLHKPIGLSSSICTSLYCCVWYWYSSHSPVYLVIDYKHQNNDKLANSWLCKRIACRYVAEAPTDDAPFMVVQGSTAGLSPFYNKFTAKSGLSLWATQGPLSTTGDKINQNS